MKKKSFGKILVIGLIILFAGASVLPSISGIIIKNNISYLKNKIDSSTNYENKPSNFKLNSKELNLNLIKKLNWDASASFTVFILWTSRNVEITALNVPQYWYGGTFNIALLSQGPIFIGADYRTKMTGYYKVDIECGDRKIDGEKHYFDAYWGPDINDKEYYHEDYEKEGHWSFPTLYPANIYVKLEVNGTRFIWDDDEGEWVYAFPRWIHESHIEHAYMQVKKNKVQIFDSLFSNLLKNHPLLFLFYQQLIGL